VNFADSLTPLTKIIREFPPRPFLNGIADRPIGGERVYKGPIPGGHKWKFRLIAQLNGPSLIAAV
jgi:hypothetical protein